MLQLKIEVHIHGGMLFAITFKNRLRLLFLLPYLFEIESFSVFDHVGDDIEAVSIGLQDASPDGVGILFPLCLDLQDSGLQG